MVGLWQWRPRCFTANLCCSLSTQLESKYQRGQHFLFLKNQGLGTCLPCYMSEVTMAATSSLCPRVQQVPDIGTPQCSFAFLPKSPSLLAFSSLDLAVLEGSCLIFCLGIILFSILFRVWEWETIHQPTQEWVSNHGGEEQLDCHHLWWALSHLHEGFFFPGGQDQPSFPKGSKSRPSAHD